VRLVTIYLGTLASSNELAEMYDISVSDADGLSHMEISVTIDLDTGDIVGADGRKLSDEII